MGKWLALGLLGLALLAGCTPQDRVMTTIEGGALVFIACTPIEGVQHIEASQADTVLWHSRGEDGVFGPTTPITFGVDPSGFVTDMGPISVEFNGERIYFSLTNTAVDSRTWVIDTDDLVEGKWLDESGRLHDEHCT